MATSPMKTTVYDQIEELLAANGSGGPPPSRERLEDALTTGYAAALELDGERARLERRIAERARKLAEGDGGEWGEVAALV